MLPRLLQIALTLPLLILPFHVVPEQGQHSDREPAVAGTFYPSDPSELRSMLDGFFANAVRSRNLMHVVGIIVPHAGYVFSGQVDASGFRQIDTAAGYENVFVIGPSHYVGFTGAAVYTAGDYRTPLGSVHVNQGIGRALLKESHLFTDRTDAQAREHSVEVEIPFLQHLFGPRLSIVPIVMGSDSPQECEAIARVLRPYNNGRNLFVISSDFSHYPNYADAVRVDSITASAILSNSPSTLAQTLERNDARGIPNLATSLCGWSAVLTFLSMTSDDPAIHLEKIQYKNSGDSPFGERDRVVGYCAIVANKEDDDPPEQGFQLAPEAKHALLAIARETLERNIREGDIPSIDPLTLPASLKVSCGAFVTLNKNGRLRGCIGRFNPEQPLYVVVQEMTVAAATQDYRFPPVSRSELGDIHMEISVLTPLRKISSADEFDPSKHGIYIRKGSRSGTFLPQVAKETGWTKEQLLGHCAEEKAGIGWDGWRDANLYVYEAIVFGE